MDINANLKNNLNLLLKSKASNKTSNNKNKKFVQSFFNIKSNLGYQTATANSFHDINNNINNNKEINFLQRKTFEPLDEKEIKKEEKLKPKNKDIINTQKNSLILKLEKNKKLVQIENSKLSQIKYDENVFINSESDSDNNKDKKHSKWKLYKIITGHTGWVRCIDMDPSNNFFVTGSNDRVIKFWDFPTGKLKLSYTGHINTIRKVVLSKRNPYLFSCGEDKKIKCWDLETNKAIRQYHGHLSGVYTLSLHPNLDIFVTGGRDCVARVWDIRSRQQIMCLEGHTNTVYSAIMQENEPQIITGSSDCTIKLWDIRNGSIINTLTHHKKCIRDLLIPKNEYSFLSAAADDIKVWSCPEGKFIRDIRDGNVEIGKEMGIVNCLALNDEGILVCGGEDGKLFFWDYESGEIFQKIKTPIQPGSMECESQIFDCIFDMTETRLITTGCDKTIKMFKQVDEEEEEYSSDNDEEKDSDEYNKNNNKKKKNKYQINLNENDDEEESEDEQ